MAVLFDKKHRKYYIDTKIKKPDGNYHHFVYRENDNPDFSSKRYVQSLESDIIKKKKQELMFAGTSKVQNIEALNNSYIEYKSNELAYYTLRNNSLRAKRYIVNFFENSLEKFFTPANCALFRTFMSSKKISTDYMNKVIAYARELIRYARILGIINSDQKDDCLVPLSPIKKKVEEVKEVKNKYTPLAELEKLLAVIDNKNDYTILKLFYYSGLRVGEFLGIEVGDITLSDDLAIITIKRQRLKNGTITSSLKTQASYKRIVYTDSNVNLLKEYIVRNKFKRNDMLFPFSDQSLRNKLTYYLNKASLPHNTLHGFGRKSINTELYRAGADSKVRTTLLGQSSVEVNESHYIDNQTAFNEGINFIRNLTK